MAIHARRHCSEGLAHLQQIRLTQRSIIRAGYGSYFHSRNLHKTRLLFPAACSLRRARMPNEPSKCLNLNQLLRKCEPRSEVGQDDILRRVANPQRRFGTSRLESPRSAGPGITKRTEEVLFYQQNSSEPRAPSRPSSASLRLRVPSASPNPPTRGRIPLPRRLPIFPSDPFHTRSHFFSR